MKGGLLRSPTVGADGQNCLAPPSRPAHGSGLSDPAGEDGLIQTRG